MILVYNIWVIYTYACIWWHFSENIFSSNLRPKCTKPYLEIKDFQWSGDIISPGRVDRNTFQEWQRQWKILFSGWNVSRH